MKNNEYKNEIKLLNLRMSEMNPEDMILAHNIKTERQAIPVVITAAIESGRICENDYVDDGLRDLDEVLKKDAQEAKEKFTTANSEERKAENEFTRRKALISGQKKPKTQRDKGMLS